MEPPFFIDQFPEPLLMLEVYIGFFGDIKKESRWNVKMPSSFSNIYVTRKSQGIYEFSEGVVQHIETKLF